MFWTIQRGLQSRPLLAAIPSLARPSYRFDLSSPINDSQRVPRSLQNVNIATRIRRHRARINQWLITRRFPILGHALLTVPSDRADNPALHIDRAYPAVIEVCQVHPLKFRIKGHTVNITELRFLGRPAIAAKALLARPRKVGDDAALGINLSYAAVE